MSATTVMLAAWGALILGHWAHKQPTLTVRQVIEMTSAVLLIAFLDSSPQTESVAKGFAWLFLAVVLLGDNSILTALAKTVGTGTTAPKGA